MLARTLLRQPNRKFSSKQPMDAAAMDAAIAEMNAEMSELFGSEMGEVNPSSGITSNVELPLPPPRQPPQAAPLQASRLPSPSGAEIAEVASAKSALLQAISAASSDLSSKSFEVERSSKLAACIAECARAFAALDQIER